MGLDEDIPPGERLVAYFRPFIDSLAASGRSYRIVQEHVDNTWALGGQFISELNYDPMLRKRPVDRVLRGTDPLRRPHLRDADEAEQASFDTTCEMFRRSLGKTAY
jgi:hypothetical protein